MSGELSEEAAVEASPGGFDLRLVRVWTQPESTLITPYKMIDSLLYVPRGAAPDVPRPGVLFVHGWGRYPYDELPAALGPLLAQQGVLVLSLAMRRRGGEGQAAAMPGDDVADIAAGLDVLGHFGASEIVLAGQDIGALSVTRYLADTGDSRVLGLAWADPIDDPAQWLAERLPADRLEAVMQTARQAAYEMKSDFARIDMDIPLAGRTPMWIIQPPVQFLAWWGGAKRLCLSHLRDEIAVPIHTVSTEDSSAPEAVATEIAKWCEEVLPRPIDPIHTELVTVRTDGDARLVGYLRAPEHDVRSDAAVLIVHGLSTGPFSPMARQFMSHYSDQGFACLAMESRRSGYRVIADSDPAFDESDIDAFVELLVKRGWPKVVLVGASQGSHAVSYYVARRHHPAVAAAVHLAPSGESARYFAEGVGRDRYGELVSEARDAVAAGHPEHLIVTTLQEPPPAAFAPVRRHYWRAASWLAWWVDIESHLDLLGEVDVPTLLVAGTSDDYTDKERMEKVAAALAKAPLVSQHWYQADHALKGVEAQVVHDIAAWLESNDIVERRGQPLEEDPRPAAEPTPRLRLRDVGADARGLRS